MDAIIEPEVLTPQAAYSTQQFCTLAFGSAVAVACLRKVLDKFFFQPMGRTLLLDEKQRKLKVLPIKAQSKVSKFTESTWKFMIYFFFEVYGLYALHDKAWLTNTATYWEDWGHQLQSKRVQQYYYMQTGFYVSAIFMLCFWETRRKDFFVMLTHHWTTLFLLVTSIMLGMERPGSIVLLLHDFSDVLLEVAKIFNYLEQETISMVFFASMAASWFYLRLVLYPRYIIWSVMFEYKSMYGEWTPYWWPINIMLCALLVMHVYWFWLIIKVAWRALSSGQQKDVREDADD